MILGIVSLGSSVQLMQLVGSSKTTILEICYQTLDLLKCDDFHWISTCVFIFGRTFLTWVQTPAELLDGAYTYLVIVGISLIFQSITTSISTVFRSFTIC